MDRHRSPPSCAESFSPPTRLLTLCADVLSPLRGRAGILAGSLMVGLGKYRRNQPGSIRHLHFVERDGEGSRELEWLPDAQCLFDFTALDGYRECMVCLTPSIVSILKRSRLTIKRLKNQRTYASASCLNLPSLIQPQRTRSVLAVDVGYGR